MLKKICSLVFLFLAASMCNFSNANAASTNFDFDSGTPALSTGQSVPLSQTKDGLTSSFSSTPGLGGYSIQSDATTGFHLSLFSGKYLYPNSLNPGNLQIAFSKPLNDLSFVFATADFQQVEVPTTIQLDAYDKSNGSVFIGSATAHGTYAGDTMPMGSLSFNAAGKAFNWVEISIPPQPLGASDFLVDNILGTVSPEPISSTLFLLGGGLMALWSYRRKNALQSCFHTLNTTAPS